MTTKINEAFIESILGGLIALLTVASFLWIKNNGLSDSTSIIALATITYTIFTASMFWSNKSSSESQVRPFLYTKLKENMDLKIMNALNQNVAKNLKIKIKAVETKKDMRKSNFLFFVDKHFWRWVFFSKKSKIYEDYFEIMEDNKSPSLVKFLERKFPIKEVGGEYEGFSLSVKNKETEIKLKILIDISYESLIDKDYQMFEIYYVFIKNGKVEIKKNPNLN